MTFIFAELDVLVGQLLSINENLVSKLTGKDEKNEKNERKTKKKKSGAGLKSKGPQSTASSPSRSH